jgi:Short C-terminal domain/Phospholipase_D-nuclease N-terminal
MPLLDVFFATMWLFLWILWIFLLVRIIIDIFRSHDLNGWGKAGWLAFVIILPFLGVLVYVLARGGKMSERGVEDAQARDNAFRSYVRDAANEGGSADQIAKLADLRDRGVITEDDFQHGKARVLRKAA